MENIFEIFSSFWIKLDVMTWVLEEAWELGFKMGDWGCVDVGYLVEQAKEAI
jgi:hypothetical protein